MHINALNNFLNMCIDSFIVSKSYEIHMHQLIQIKKENSVNRDFRYLGVIL